MSVRKPLAGGIKQSIRDELLVNVEQYSRRCLRKGNPFSILSLPGIEGISNPLSFENRVLDKYPEAYITGLEEDKDTYNHMVSEMPDDNRLLLFQMAAESFIRRTTGVFNVVFLDYCGSAKSKAIQSWASLLDKGMIADGGILAVTICRSGRSAKVNKRNLGGNEVSHLKGKLLELARRSSYYRICYSLFAREYSNRDVSTKALDMMMVAIYLNS